MNGSLVQGPWGGRPAVSQDALFDAPAPPAPPDDHGEDADRHGGGGGRGGAAGKGHGDFGPVVPLGVVTRRESTRYMLLDAAGKQAVYSARDIRNTDGVYGLFGGDAGLRHLMRLWPHQVMEKDEEGKPKLGADGKPEMKTVGWSAKAAGGALMAECTRLGDAETLERRRDGVWRSDDGGLVVHTGAWLHCVPEAQQLPAGRRLGDALYLRSAAQGEPARDEATVADCLRLAEGFKMWRFAEADKASAPTLLLGMVACGILGGALAWRPHMWLRGSSNAGKSTLLDVIVAAVGTDPRKKGVSEPFVRRKFDQRAKLIVLDEEEPDLAGVTNILVLMRGASDAGGGRIGKVIDGEAKEFAIASPFLLSAISTPAFEPQDASRITTLRLLRNTVDRRKELEALLALAKALSPGLLTRLMLGWDRFLANQVVYRGALMGGRATSRCADQLAALLAGNRTLVDDSAIDPMAAAEEINVLELRVITPDEAAEDDAPTQVLAHLLASRVLYGDGRESRTVAQVVEGLRDALAEWQAAKHSPDPSVALLRKTAEREVDRAGALKLRWSREGLIIGNGSPLLNRAFEGTPWANRVWEQALRDLPGAADAGSMKFRGAPQSRAVLVPHGLLGLMEARGRPDIPRAPDD